MKKSLILNRSNIEIINAPEPSEVVIPLPGFLADDGKIKRKIGNSVVTGETILPDIISPVTGKIIGIDTLERIEGECTVLRVEVAEKEQTDSELKGDPDFLEKDPGDLWLKLNRANLNFIPAPEQLDTVVISAVESDPLAGVARAILNQSLPVVIEGLKLIRFVTAARKVILALPNGMNHMDVDITAELAEIFRVDPVYPAGLPEVLIRSISRKHDLGRCGFLPVEKLVGAVDAIKAGKPFVYKIVTVAGEKGIKNYRVRIGTPLKELIKDFEIGGQGKLIVGGPLRGYTSYHDRSPVDERTDLIVVQNESDVVIMENKPCINCGNCVRSCPVQLDVNLICRYAEFSLFDACGEMGLLDCLECGLCAYHCPSLRSLVQLIKLAKSELEKKEGERAE